MLQPVRDPFWTEAAVFVRGTVGVEKPFIGPRELRAVLPKVFAYDWVYAIDKIEDYAGILVHKGLLHEIPLGVLRRIKNEWKCVFANAVFLFFMPPASPLSIIANEHVHSFDDALRCVEKVAASRHPVVREQTMFLAIASHAPEGLDNLLRSLGPFNVPLLVVAGTGDKARRNAYQAICAVHRVGFDDSISCANPREALKAGVVRSMEGEGIDWIATFDDTVVARPDFLFVMEKFRHSETCPALSGDWMPSDGARRSFQRDGVRIVVPRHQNDFLLYAHVNYWSRRLRIGKKPGTGLSEVFAIPQLVFRQKANVTAPQPSV